MVNFKVFSIVNLFFDDVNNNISHEQLPDRHFYQSSFQKASKMSVYCLPLSKVYKLVCSLGPTSTVSRFTNRIIAICDDVLTFLFFDMPQ